MRSWPRDRLVRHPTVGGCDAAMTAKCPMHELVVDPGAEARDRVGGRFDVRVLEPSPPAVAAPPWFADDPVHTDRGAAAVRSSRPSRSAARPRRGTTWSATSPSSRPWCADRWLGAWRRARAARRIVDALGRDPQRVARRWPSTCVAPARHRANGKIGLRFTRGGFGTPFFGADEQVRVASDGLVVVRDGELDDPPDHAPRAARPRRSASSRRADRRLHADDHARRRTRRSRSTPASARFLGDWFGFGASVLEELRGRGARRRRSPRGCSSGPSTSTCRSTSATRRPARRGTYGASPGDAAHAEPYLYVTPWAGRPATSGTRARSRASAFTELRRRARPARAARASSSPRPGPSSRADRRPPGISPVGRPDPGGTVGRWARSVS